MWSGGGGIRTLVGGEPPETVFETAAFNRSATPPGPRLRGQQGSAACTAEALGPDAPVVAVTGASAASLPKVAPS